MLRQEGANEAELQATLNELHKSFATLSQEEQKYANIFLHDVERGDVDLEPGRTLRDYITQYQSTAKRDQIQKITDLLGLDKEKLVSMMQSSVTASNLNEYGRFDELKERGQGQSEGLF